MPDYWSTYIQPGAPLQAVEGLQDAFSIRRVILSNVLRTRECNSNSAEAREFFARELGPGVPVSLLEKPFNPTKREGVSTCGLWAEHQQAHAGMAVPGYDRNYYPIKGGVHYSITRTIAAGQKWGAWRECERVVEVGAQVLPKCASFVVIGKRTLGELYAGTEHVVMIARFLGDGEFETVEAGAVDPKTGLQRVEVRSRFFEWRPAPGGKCEAWLPRVRGGSGRKVVGWLDPDLCEYNWKGEAAEGWEELPLWDPVGGFEAEEPPTRPSP